MIERIQLIIKLKNLTASKFADEIGVQRSAISHLLSGRNKPSLEFIQKLLSRFPEIRAEWLISGKGQMNKELQLFGSDNITPNDIENEFIKQNELKEQKNEIINNTENSSDNSETDFQINMKDTQPRTNIYSKTIEKIIVFYTDKTFTDYTPEKQG